MSMSFRWRTLSFVLVLSACGSPEGEPAASGQTPLPCDVADVLSRNCWGCHSAAPDYGAPMALTTWEETQVSSSSNMPMYQSIRARIHDPVAPMPQIGRLSVADMAVLEAWIDQGAPAGTEPATACQLDPAGPELTTGPPALPGGGPVDYGVDQPVPPEPSECEEELHFVARADASGAPFPVPENTIDRYQCFSFSLPFDAPMQGLAFYPEIDNSRVIHHWLLYQTDTPLVDGETKGCVGWHPDATLLAGWAPGATPWYLPKHVGMDLGSGNFLLEVHYNNLGGDAVDASGVRVCATRTLRPQTASVSWLGTETIRVPPATENVEVTSRCTPKNVTEPIHVLRSWPHMHQLGVHMRATIHRAQGGTEPLLDVPFSFYQQWQYDTPAVLNPGDSITTTCVYSNPGPELVKFGQPTSAEMCYNFTVAYPAESLVSTGLMHNACND